MTPSDKLREIAEDKKPVHVKPGLYSLFFYDLKQIAKRYGYNLVLHGSLNRDLDLIAIPWVDKPKPEQNMIKSFQRYLSGFTTTCPDGKVHFTVLPGNRHSYIIELNRGNRRGEWMRHKDEQYYLDISVVQLSDLTALISENYVERAKYDEAVRQRDELKEALEEQKRLYFNLFDEDVSCMYCEVKLKRGSAIILCKECAESTEV